MCIWRPDPGHQNTESSSSEFRVIFLDLLRAVIVKPVTYM